MKPINFTMYAGFSDMLLKDGIEKTCETALRLGFSSVESFADTMPGADNAIPDQLAARKVKNALSQAGLSVACHSVFADVWKNDHAERELMKQLEIAYELGSPFYHHTLLPWMKLPADAPEYQEAVKCAVDIAARVADFAKTMGIVCIYEDQGYCVNGVKGFGSFYNEIKKRCANVGVCADLGNILFVGERPEAFLQAFIQDICHVHAKDYLWKQTKECPGRYWSRAKGNNWLRDTIAGSGVVDLAACMRILHKNGYQGTISLETIPSDFYEEGVWQTMEYFRQVIV